MFVYRFFRVISGIWHKPSGENWLRRYSSMKTSGPFAQLRRLTLKP